MADMDLFQDLKENPFDAHFRKAAEAVKQGADSLSASVSATEITDDTLNTPQIYCTDATAPQITQLTPSIPRPVILRANPKNRAVCSAVPIASVQPVKIYKPIAPNLASLPTVPSPDNAMLLLKFPGGETIKLSNLPFIKADPPPSPTVNHETRLKLKRVLSTPRGMPVDIRSPTQTTPVSPTSYKTNVNEQINEEGEKNELKERNRMSAQRSRQKKRQHFNSLADTCSNMQKENSALNTENKVLREEIVSLKRLLEQHLDCSLSQQAGQREIVQSAIEPKMVSLVGAPKRKEKSVETQKTVSKQNYLNFPIGQSTDGSEPSTSETIVDTIKLIPSKYEKRTKLMMNTNKPVCVVPSPPQTFPEDLRVDTRLKDTEESQFSISGPSFIIASDEKEKLKILPKASECVKQTLARHCHRVGSEREEKNTNKGVVAKRLKDKLQILKEKMAEDATKFSGIS